jgi:hypothetical protein
MMSRPVRANRGNRLKTLIDATFAEDDLAEAWKESEDDLSCHATSSSSDSADSDFSATESSGQLTDAEAERSSSEQRTQKKKHRTELPPLRERKKSSLTQEQRMTLAFQRAIANGVALREFEQRILINDVVAPKTAAAVNNVLFHSSARLMSAIGLSHVLGV